MVKRVLLKPDGRRLILYAREEIRVDDPPPSPPAGPFAPNAHLRWHPLRG